jgi:hypothetical protein
LFDFLFIFGRNILACGNKKRFNAKVYKRVQRAFGEKKIAQKSPYFEGKKKSSIAIFRQRLP